jgi:hypothetical protein
LNLPSCAAQALAILLAVVLVWVPMCQPSACSHACCPGHSGDCQSGADLSAALNCAQAVLSPTLAPAPSSDGVRWLAAFAHGFASADRMAVSERGASPGTLVRPPAAPAPPLRI